jgi:dTDP-4-amino-4,6-dideoxygalactose transaminase
MRIPLNDLSRRAAAHAGPLQAAVREVLERGWYVMGPQHDAFEREFAAYCGAAFALGVANGTDALELALRAAGCGAGDEVILAPNAGFYAATAALAIGAEPIYADVDPESLTLDPAAAAAFASPRTRAVVATHLFGNLADMAGLERVFAGSGVAVIEDCAQAHGARRGGRRAGSFGMIAAFSFYPTKNLGAAGDGGAVVTGSGEMAARLRRLRQYGWTARYVTGAAGGRNSRLDELQAAVLRVLLPGLDAANARRRAIVAAYSAALPVGARLVTRMGEDATAHLCVLRHPERDRLRAHLESRGVGCDIHYPLLDTQQAALQGRRWRAGPLVQSELAVREILTVPCFPEMTEDETAHVARALAEFA